MGLVEREVVSFVAEQIGVPKHRVRVYTTLFGDLHVHGDDAEDLMVEFARRFEVDLAEFDLGRHFEPEHSSRVAPVLVLLRRLVGQTPEEAAGLEPLTVRDLVAAASAGRWTPRARPSAEEAVYRVLEDLGVKPADARRHEAKLLELVLDEDATFGFVPDVQESRNPGSERGLGARLDGRRGDRPAAGARSGPARGGRMKKALRTIAVLSLLTIAAIIVEIAVSSWPPRLPGIVGIVAAGVGFACALFGLMTVFKPAAACRSRSWLGSPAVRRAGLVARRRPGGHPAGRAGDRRTGRAHQSQTDLPPGDAPARTHRLEEAAMRGASHSGLTVRIAAACVALGGVQGCRHEAAATPESRLLAEIANVAGVHGRGYVGRRDGGPLMIDVGSFARYGRPVFGADVSKRQIEASLRAPYHDARERFAVRCWYLPYRCHIWRDGVFVRVDSVTRRRGGGFDVFVTCFGTDDHHRSRRLLSFAGLRIEVRRAGAGWVVSPPVLVDIT
jgi:hypothetical protein